MDIIANMSDEHSYSLCSPCLICEELVELTQEESISVLRFNRSIPNKVCNKCKQSILYINKNIDKVKELIHG